MPMSPRLLRPRAAVSTGFDPRSIAGLGVWYDASVASSITLNGSTVSQWNDLSGNNRHLTQTTANQQPGYQANALNGRAVLTFNGTSQRMFTTSGGASGTTTSSIFAVVRFAAAPANEDVLVGVGQSGQTGRCRILYRGSGQQTMGFSGWGADLFTSNSSVDAGGTHHVFSTLQTGQTIQVARNGVRGSFTANGTIAPVTSNNVFVGGIDTTADANSRFFEGTIAEVVVYYQDIGTAAAQQVEQYLGRKWGIYPHAPPNYADADVNAYINAVEAADQNHLEPAVRDAINAFVTGCKADGTWSAIKASCILAGARTLSGALTPLVGSAPTPFNFAASDYNRRTGLIGNGSSKYLNTNRAANADPQNNFHASVFGSALDPGAGAFVRAWIGSSSPGFSVKNLGLFHYNGAYYFNLRRDSQNTLTNATLATFGFVGGIRTSSTNIVGRFSGSDNAFSVPSQPPSAEPTAVFASNTGGTIGDYSAARIAFYSIGESLPLASLDSRVTALYNGISAAFIPQVANADAQNWLNRVYDNGGTVSTTTAAAVNTFCNAIDAAGIRDRFYRLNLFCGDQLAAALVPLYRAESSTASARGNTTDTNNGPFVEADYVSTGSTGGLIGNGTSKFLNTGLAANSMTATDVHLAISLRTAQTAGNFDKTAIGAYNTSGTLIYALDLCRPTAVSTGVAAFGNYNSGAFFGESANTAPIATGHIVATSITASPAMYRNGSQVGTTSGARTNYNAAHSLYIYANNNGQTSAAVNHTNARLGGYSIGLGMTQAQAQAYSNAVSAFNTALSRT